MIKEKNSILKEHFAFRSFRNQLLTLIASQGEIVTFKKNATIIKHSTKSTDLYFLLEGFVQLLDKNKRTVLALSPNQGHFGWNDYEEKYTYNAVAMSDEVTLFKISSENLNKLFNSYNQLKRLLFLYRIPFGPHQFFRSFNIPNYNIEDENFITSFKTEFFKVDEHIVTKGDEADKFYMIVNGESRVDINEPEQEEKIVAHLKRGDYFGEIALLKKGNRNASVIADTDLTVFSLNRAAFDKFISTRKGFLVKEIMLQRINTYSTDVELLVIGTSQECQLKVEHDKVAPRHLSIAKKTMDDGSIQYFVKPLASTSRYKVFVNKKPISKETSIAFKDEIIFADFMVVVDPVRKSVNLQRTNFFQLHVENLRLSIDDKQIIDDVSFDAESGELVSIMGPSGCGKSTILELIYGSRKQTTGTITYNNDPLEENLDYYRNSFGFVPQDDILFPELTVFQNLYFSAKLREPLATDEELTRKIDFVLHKLKLLEHKNSRVGSVEEKGLSGGQRKRVNIARELIFDPHILYLDEPTSGLSSKDSEDIIEVLRGLANNGKLIFIVLHQPSSKIFKNFDKIVFLDKGGRLVYTGDVIDCISYMKEVIETEDPDICPTCETTQPEIIFEVLEAKKSNGERKFSPEFWKQRFKERNQSLIDDEDIETIKGAKPFVEKASIKEHAIQMFMLLKRVFLLKLHNKNNLILAVGAPIVISILLAVILYNTDESGNYSFYRNKLILVYLFVGVIFSIFLGLTNSVRDIVSEKAIYNLESKIKLKIPWYVLSKFFVIALIAAFQIALFVIIGNSILEIKGMFWDFFIVLFLVEVLGISFGLFLSTIVKSSEAVVNWIPIILIPQIILGGALIEFEDMSRDLYLDAQQVIPEICQIIPSRWAHEALIVSQATLNPRDATLTESSEKINEISKRLRALKKDADENKTTIDDLKKERKEIRSNRSVVDENFPAEEYKNELLEQAVTNGLGVYSGHKYDMIDDEKRNDYGLFVTYEFKPKEDANIYSFNAPFYSQYKGIKIGSTYYEIETTFFNKVVLLLMSILSLIFCMTSLKIKKLYSP